MTVARYVDNVRHFVKGHKADSLNILTTGHNNNAIRLITYENSPCLDKAPIGSMFDV